MRYKKDIKSFEAKDQKEFMRLINWIWRGSLEVKKRRKRTSFDTSRVLEEKRTTWFERNKGYLFMGVMILFVLKCLSNYKSAIDYKETQSAFAQYEDPYSLENSLQAYVNKFWPHHKNQLATLIKLNVQSEKHIVDDGIVSYIIISVDWNQASLGESWQNISFVVYDMSENILSTVRLQCMASYKWIWSIVVEVEEGTLWNNDIYPYVSNVLKLLSGWEF